MDKRTLMISPSKLESYRKFKDEEYNGFITEEKVIESIMGAQVWSQAMTFGSAFHAVIENGHEGYLKPDGLYHIIEEGMENEVICTIEELEEAIKYKAQHPYMVHECKAKTWITVNGYRVLLNMRIDGMEGLQVHEHKTAKQIDLESYERSIQWKIYLLATGAQFVQYNIFKIYEPRSGPRRVEPFSFRLFPYEGLERDINVLTHSFIDFCERRGLMSHIQSYY